MTNTRQQKSREYPGDRTAFSAARYATEDVLRVLADRLEDHAIIVTDPVGRIEMWNQGAERLSGRSSSDTAGGNLASVGLPFPAPGMTQAFERALRDGVYETMGWWQSQTGGQHWVDLMVAPLSTHQGQHTGFVIVVQDRTEYRRWEEERNTALQREADVRSHLRAAEQRAAFLAEATSILAASSLDVQGTVKSLARLAVSSLADWCVIYTIGNDRKVHRTEVAHRHPDGEDLLQRVMTGPLQPRRKHPVLAVIKTGSPELLPTVSEEVLHAIAGSQDQLVVFRELGLATAMFAPLIARGRVLGGILFAGVDPGHPFDSEQLRLADELARRAAIAIDNARLYAEAQEASRAKSDFLAVVSHELRTPLNAIMGYADLIDSGVSGDVTEQQQQQLGRIRASARHLLQLIEEILGFARLEAGGTELEIETTTIDGLVEDVITVIEPLAEGRSLALNVDIQDGSAMLTTDVAKVRQILVNLLSNAVKFTPQGSVGLHACVDKQSAIFEVRDTGVGIESGLAHRIFDPFWQAEKPNTRRVGGTGLGLSIARRYVALLKGEIRLDSEVGIGSTFTVRLPLEPKSRKR